MAALPLKMSDILVQAENLSKRYTIGHQRDSRDGLRHALEDFCRNPFRWMKSRQKSSEDFWALRDVDFQVKQGEIFGIVGRNGAGKSTLLKILSRITEPTTGRLSLQGRVASLLEVGTGFHQELTGRENIFLNGAILGMTRVEIKRKFDEIVAFSEVEKFLDTPVKRYSSGMYVRLAFAVAAHLEPDILIVDEVLAVGDMQFQKKCLGKMQDVSTLQGRTVLFVSHNMAALKTLCTHGMHLCEGRLTYFGGIDDTIRAYHQHDAQVASSSADLANRTRRGSGKLRFISVVLSFYDAAGAPADCLSRGGDVQVSVVIESTEPAAPANVAVVVYDSTPYRLIDAHVASKGQAVSIEKGKTATLAFRLKNIYLKPDLYSVTLWAGRGGIEDFDWIEDAVSFEVAPDLTSTKHTEVFPGPYQCEFDVRGCNNIKYDDHYTAVVENAS